MNQLPEELKEFLSIRAIGFESINVLEDAAGLAELTRLGARSVPVLARGEDFVFGQSLGDIVRFLGLEEKTGPVLSPARLIERLDRTLATASRTIRQMPDDRLAAEVPNRPRTYRVLAHHIFRIPEAFLEATRGVLLTHELLTGAPPEAMRSTADIVTYGDDVRRRLGAWWDAEADRSGQETVQTYYGPQQLHELLERTTWHAMQHVRQWAMLLRMEGIEPDRPLDAADFADLPMPSRPWDG